MAVQGQGPEAKAIDVIADIRNMVENTPVHQDDLETVGVGPIHIVVNHHINKTHTEVDVEVTVDRRLQTIEIDTMTDLCLRQVGVLVCLD
jgi:hypothetical protein